MNTEIHITMRLGAGMAPAGCFWVADVQEWNEGIPSR